MATIIVVDDDRDFTESATLLLEQAGYNVLSAPNREAGMSLLSDRAWDLCILDVMMNDPDDGIVMARDVRKLGFSQPIIMLSSISHVSGMPYGRDDEVTPVDEFIEKPVKPETLIKTVERFLGDPNRGGRHAES